MDKSILFLQGALSSSQFWQNQNSYFSKGFDVYHPELSSLHHPQIFEMAKSISNNIQRKSIVVGFSLGGYIAIELALSFPEKISGLVLINSSAQSISLKGKEERLKVIDLIKRGRFEVLLKKIFKNSFFDSKGYLSNIALLLDMAKTIDSDAYLAQLQALLGVECKLNRLSDISFPTLILHSDTDLVMPNDRSKKMHELFLQSDLVEVTKCGHMMPLERPTQVNKIIDQWIDERLLHA